MCAALCPDDLRELDQIRSVVLAKYQRHKPVKSFCQTLSIFRSFCERHDADDWRRCLACGICWLDGRLAVNTRQLMALTGRSKSSINNLFAKFECRKVALNKQNESMLIQKIPYLAEHPNEMKQWTYRVGKARTPQTKQDDQNEEEEAEQDGDGERFGDDPMHWLFSI
jgi:hypothetical protein